MSQRRIPTYMFQAPSGSYYFRIRIPKAIREKLSLRKKEFRENLQTKDFMIGWPRAQNRYQQMGRIINLIKEDIFNLKQTEISKLFREYEFARQGNQNNEIIAEDFELTDLGIFLHSLTEKGAKQLNKDLEIFENLHPMERAEFRASELIKMRTLKSNVPNQSSDNQYSDELVSKCAQEFLNHYSEKRQRNQNKVPKTTLTEYQSALNTFIEIIGPEKRCCDLNKSLIKDYEKSLWAIPKNHSRLKRYKDKSIKELMKLSLYDEDKRSPKTLDKNFIFIKKFLRWLAKEDYIETGLDAHIENVSDSERQDEKWDEFTPEELSLLFHNPIYEKGIFEHPAQYWMPLLALFTGARPNELAQLYKDDIIKEDKTGIFYIRITRDENRLQSLKNKNSQRIIPIHSKLINRGFIDFVNKADDDSMIFPELFNKDGKHYKVFGNRFNRKDAGGGWKQKYGVTREKTSFYSFRHLVVNKLSELDIQDKIACDIVGHGNDNSRLVKNYVKRSEIEAMKEAIEKLSYPSINFRKFKKIDWK